MKTTQEQFNEAMNRSIVKTDRLVRYAKRCAGSKEALAVIEQYDDEGWVNVHTANRFLATLPAPIQDQLS